VHVAEVATEERRTKFQPSLAPVGKGDAFYTIFLIGDFADALPTKSYWRWVRWVTV
jgi:hypothetical protein